MTIDSVGQGQPLGHEPDKPPMPEIVRPQVSDITELLGLWRGQYDYHHERWPDQYAPFTDELKTRVEAGLHKVVTADEAQIFAAKEEGHIVGFVTFGLEDDDYYDAAVERYGVIKEVFVSEDARRRGIGPALTIKARDSLLHEQGMTHVKIQYAADNEEARAAYAKVGFVPAQETAIFTNPDFS